MTTRSPRAVATRRELVRARRLVWRLRGALPDAPGATVYLIDAMQRLAELPSSRAVCDARSTLARVVLVEWLPVAFAYCETIADADHRHACIVELGQLTETFTRWLIDAYDVGLVQPAEDCVTFDAAATRAFVETLSAAAAHGDVAGVRLLIGSVVAAGAAVPA